MSGLNSCYTCQYSEILDKPEYYTDGIDSGDLYGYCHKNNGKYKIFIPGAKCKDFKAKEVPKVSEELQEVVDRRTLWVGYEIGSNEQAKNIIRNNINRMCDSWISTGFVLKQARDKEFYKQDGYSCIQDYAFGEFGIKKQRASRLIKIIEDLSINGNSPVLEDRWKEFSIAKLEEIIYLDENQQEQVAIGTTVAQIREIKNPEKVSTSKLEPESAAPVNAKPKAHNLVIDFTRSLDSLAREFEEKGGCPPDQASCRRNWTEDYYDRKKNGPCKDCISCWKDWLTSEKIRAGIADQEEIQEPAHVEADCDSCDKSDENALVTEEQHNEAWFVKQYFDRYPTDLAKLMLMCRKSKVRGEIAKEFQQYISPYGAHNIGCSDWEFDFHNFAGGMDFRVSDENIHLKYGRLVEEVMKLYNPFASVYDEPRPNKKPETVNNRPEIVDNQPETVNDVEKSVIETAESVTDKQEDVIYPEGDDYYPELQGHDPESEQIETVEADIVQTDPSKYHDGHVESLLQDHMTNLKEYSAAGMPDNLIKKQKMYVDALTMLAREMQRPPVSEEPKQVQPGLPMLKNNDQRKEWAENYKAWGEWYYDEHIDCHYYKYDFENGDRLVVEEYKGLIRYWNRNEEFDQANYHLCVKQKTSRWIKTPYEQRYEHSTTSITEIVEYLKDFQKKGA